MFKVIATDVVISKGYDGAPALKFSENGESVRFRIGKKVYDTRAENNTRWVNLSVKAFGPVCEEVKILILVSDGQPAAPGYYGSAAEEDLRGIRQEYRRKGVLFIAAAIGEDKQNIERIYGDSFMDITDLNQLPVKLTAAVKRHMRV